MIRNRRQHRRTDAYISVLLHRDGRQEYVATTNVSSGGAFISSPAPPPPGSDVELHFRSGRGPAGSVRVIGQVVRSTDTSHAGGAGFAVRWERARCDYGAQPLRDFLSKVLTINDAWVVASEHTRTATYAFPEPSDRVDDTYEPLTRHTVPVATLELKEAARRARQEVRRDRARRRSRSTGTDGYTPEPVEQDGTPAPVDDAERGASGMPDDGFTEAPTEGYGPEQVNQLRQELADELAERGVKPAPPPPLATDDPAMAAPFVADAARELRNSFAPPPPRISDDVPLPSAQAEPGPRVAPDEPGVPGVPDLPGQPGQRDQPDQPDAQNPPDLPDSPGLPADAAASVAAIEPAAQAGPGAEATATFLNSEPEPDPFAIAAAELDEAVADAAEAITRRPKLPASVSKSVRDSDTLPRVKRSAAKRKVERGFGEEPSEKSSIRRLLSATGRLLGLRNPEEKPRLGRFAVTDDGRFYRPGQEDKPDSDGS